MIHRWAQARDATGAAVRIVLFDYKKALDLIDHRILVQKRLSMPIPRSIVHWVADFLTNRNQRVKLSHDCYSVCSEIPSRVPQGTKLGPWLFLLMINTCEPMTLAPGSLLTTLAYQRLSREKPGTKCGQISRKLVNENKFQKTKKCKSNANHWLSISQTRF